MSQILLLSLLFVAILFLVVEVLFIPGTTWFGIVGFLLGAIAIYLIFNQLGSTTGYITLSIFALVSLGLFYYGFSANTWNRFALKSKIESRVNDEQRFDVEIGQIGTTVSDLKPIGKAEFNNQYREVTTFGNFIDTGVKIKVVKIESMKIFVEKAQEMVMTTKA